MKRFNTLVPPIFNLGGTRRIQGRRGITPIRSKKKRIVKTRSSKRVENGVPVQQHTSTRSHREWEKEREKEQCTDCKWKGDQDSGGDRKWDDSQEHKEAVQRGNQEDSEQSVHPGSLQELCELSELAVTDITNETELQEEEGL